MHADLLRQISTEGCSNAGFKEYYTRRFKENVIDGVIAGATGQNYNQVRAERAARDARREQEGGTQNSTAFREKKRPDGKTDVLFNGPGDGAAHGHVVQSEGPNGGPHYHYVRDVEGRTYIDDSKQ